MADICFRSFQRWREIN